jgi:hypothetical protein
VARDSSALALAFVFLDVLAFVFLVVIPEGNLQLYLPLLVLRRHRAQKD